MIRRPLVATLLSFLLMSGCAPQGAKGPSGAPSVPEDEALVFGKIVFVEDGEDNTPYGLWRRPPVPFFYRAESQKTVRPKWKGWGEMVGKDGGFCIRLPRGTYIVYRIEYGYAVIPHVAFQAPYGADAFYVGSLFVDVETKISLTRRGLEDIKGIRVIDGFEEEAEGLMEKCPGPAGKVQKSLMVHDPSIPEEASLQQRHALLDVLNSLGMGLLMIGR